MRWNVRDDSHFGVILAEVWVWSGLQFQHHCLYWLLGVLCKCGSHLRLAAQQCSSIFYPSLRFWRHWAELGIGYIFYKRASGPRVGGCGSGWSPNKSSAYLLQFKFWAVLVWTLGSSYVWCWPSGPASPVLACKTKQSRGMRQPFFPGPRFRGG